VSESKNQRDLSKEKNPAIKVALISFAGTILVAIIGAAVTLYIKGEQHPSKSEEGVFSHCVKVEAWSDKGSQPIAGASVLLEIKNYRSTDTTDNTGCASFEIPNSLQNQRGRITVTTAEKRTKTINQDIRGSLTPIIFYPSD
jgi:hypothetical protein